MNALAEIESRFPVLDWKVGGIPMWPMLRVRWMFTEWVRSDDRSGSATWSTARSGAIGRLRHMLAGAFASARDAITYPRGRDRGEVRRDLVFLSDGLSMSFIGGQWADRFCDPLISSATRLGLKSVLWTPLHERRKPRRTPTQFVQGGIDRATLMALVTRRYRARDASLPMHAEVLRALEARGFGTQYLAFNAILSDASRLRMIADYFRRRLARVRPRLGFIVSFYGLEGFAFVLACRESGVRVVELQHGVQGENHPAYAAWPAPRDGIHDLLPDRFWVWSPWEQQVIETWAKGTRHLAIAAGNPWLDVWRKDGNWSGVAEASEAARMLKERAGAKPVVLVTLQYGMSPATQLEPLARLIKAAGGQFAFWLRLHPVMLAERESVNRILSSAGLFEIDAPTELPLQALLRYADLHLTHSSTTVIEAAQFGVRSVLTSEWGAELFGPFVASGWAIVCTGDAPAAVEACVSLLGTRKSRELTVPDLHRGLRLLLDEQGQPS